MAVWFYFILFSGLWASQLYCSVDAVACEYSQLWAFQSTINDMRLCWAMRHVSYIFWQASLLRKRQDGSIKCKKCWQDLLAGWHEVAILQACAVEHVSLHKLNLLNWSMKPFSSLSAATSNDVEGSSIWNHRLTRPRYWGGGLRCISWERHQNGWLNGQNVVMALAKTHIWRGWNDETPALH